MNRLDVLLQELSIQHLSKQKAFTLSGGERRRLEITRALVTQPKFILLDEPFAGIDPIAVEDIQKIVQHLKEKGIGTGLHYPIPLHFTGAYAHLGYEKGDFPVAEKLANEILSLPIYPELTEDKIEYVCEKIKVFYKS